MRSVLLLFLMLGLVSAGTQSNYYTMKKRAYALYESGKAGEAIEKVKTFIDMHPESIRARNLLAVLYYWQGEKNKAREILEQIVSTHSFPEAERLLAKLKTGASQKKITQEKLHRQKAAVEGATESKADNQEEDLAYLLGYIRKHPQNIEVRKFLLRYYLSVGDQDAARRLAREILEIDPDEGETLALLKAKQINIVSHTAQQDKPDPLKDEAIERLNRYKAQKAYSRYLNLYQALVHQEAYLPRYVHLDALGIAVELKEYRKAKAILLRNQFPNSPGLRKLRAILDKKLKVAFTL